MTAEPTFVSIQFDLRDLPRLAQAVAVARNIVSDRAARAEPGHPIITDDVLLHALYGELRKAAQPQQENPMTTEQQDWVDDHRPEEGVPANAKPGDRTVPSLNTADRRKAAADAAPVILYNPSKEELAEARIRAGSRGVMVLPEEMRGSTIASGGGWWSPTPDETMENLTPPADEPASEHPGFEDDGLESHEWEGDDRLRKRLADIGALRVGDDPEHTVWVNAPLEVVIDEIQRTLEADRDAEQVKAREAERRFQDREHWSGETPTHETEPYKSYLADRAAMRADVIDDDETTLAEEPIEQRLRRAWLNGFKEGVDRSAYAATEATGKWDY